MHTIFALFLLPVTIADLSQQIIPNIYLKILSVFMAIALIMNGLPSSSLLFTVGLFSVVLLVLKVGMGDIKLLAILMLTFELKLISYLVVVLVIASVHIVISSLRNSAIPRSIPMAPAIFLGFITYMATR